MDSSDHFPEFASKMEKAGIAESTVRCFRESYRRLIAGDSGLIPENTIEAVSELPRLDEVAAVQEESLLAQAAVLKLNGGLGTGMGLDGPKSLLPVKEDLTFLDLIARQIVHLRRRHRVPLRLLLMNSFVTSAESLRHLQRYSELGDPKELELMQGLVPKVDAQTLRPVSWPADAQLEWCPPGHGDLYPSLLGSGWLDRLLAAGVRFLFVSNSDNLGATLDLGLLTFFANSGNDFLMEVTERTEMDRKGGHLARRSDGRLVLREAAQCPESESDLFQDVRRHHFFNTNNLWIRLDSLKTLLDRWGGALPLPLIKNAKTVDPRDKKSTPIFQLETAMGAAIECFDRAAAIHVPRSRFAPVKSTSDLLTLRSDAYEITEDGRAVLHPSLCGRIPTVDLDPEHYKFVDQLDSKLRGVPSLKCCRQLRVRGPILFHAGVVLEGDIELSNSDGIPRALPPGVYRDTAIELGMKNE